MGAAVKGTGGNEGNRNSGESSKKGSGIHRYFKLYPAFRRLLLTGIIGQRQSVGQEGGYLGWIEEAGK